MPFAKTDSQPAYLAQMTALLGTASEDHDHLGARRPWPDRASDPGVGEAAERSPTHIGIVEPMLERSALRHVSFDISWDEVAKYAVATPESIARVTAMLNRYPDRFLFGTDTVAPAGPAPYFAVFDMWAPVWKGLTPEASLKVRKGNYERLFDEAGRTSARGSGRTSSKETSMSQRGSRQIVDEAAASRLAAIGSAGRAAPGGRRCQGPGNQDAKPSMEIYGFAMLDMGHDFTAINPNWFDTLRVTKLPSFDDQFGKDNNTFAGVRQSRLGVRTGRRRHRRPEHDIRVRAVRHRRRRGPDDVPAPPCVRRTGTVWRGTDVESVHGSRRLPELD